MFSIDEAKEKSFRSFEDRVRSVHKGASLPEDDFQLKTIQKLRGNFYIAYPFLFASHYTNVDEEALEKLTLAGNLE